MLNSSRNVNWKKNCHWFETWREFSANKIHLEYYNYTWECWDFILSFCVQGTRPDRTIVFCAWGAEEHGLIGSTEWVEVGASLEQFRRKPHVAFQTDGNINTKYSHHLKMKINV